MHIPKGSKIHRPAAAAALAAVVLVVTGCSLQGTPGGSKDTSGNPPERRPVPTRFTQQKIAWEACGPEVTKDALPNAECGWVTVPVDYAAPDRANIKIRVSRIKATDQDRRLGSLLYNPGGPGAGAAADVASGAWKAGDKTMARYDLIGFDPRGIGESAPITCPKGENAPQGPDLTFSPRTRSEADTVFADAAARAKACKQVSGPVFSHMDSASVARDLDIMRAALGDKKLTYIGTSYGTYIGQKYAQLFPDRTGRLVLDGVVDPGMDMRQVTALDVKVAQDAFRRYAQDCAAQGSCPFGATADQAVDEITTFVRSLDEEPVAGLDGEDVTTEAATGSVAAVLSREEEWPALTEALDAAMDGDGAPLMRLAEDEAAPQDGDRRGPVRRVDADFNSDIAQSAVLCLDSKAPRSARQLLDDARELAERSPLFGASNAWTLLDCAAWPVPPTGSVEPITAPGAPPLLLVSFTRDAATPLENARTVQKNLGTASLITRQGAGHGAYVSGSACTDRLVDTYLVDGAVPSRNALCPN
ncbi:alpha/beta hydrolase [Streptomyces sp. NPDC059037]|uniref:alpha/beta hydrolase n=1 Tax=Streptomyces sp. NPDC059037 TaxID=3346710 RepID=UPI0036B58071